MYMKYRVSNFETLSKFRHFSNTNFVVVVYNVQNILDTTYTTYLCISGFWMIIIQNMHKEYLNLQYPQDVKALTPQNVWIHTVMNRT